MGFQRFLDFFIRNRDLIFSAIVIGSIFLVMAWAVFIDHKRDSQCKIHRPPAVEKRQCTCE